MKMVTIGGATQDIFIRYNSAQFQTAPELKDCLILAPGQKVEVDELIYQVGGGAANTAVSFARLGFDATLFCKVGHDAAADQIKQHLVYEKVRTNSIITSPDHQTATSFIINTSSGERTIFAYRGATAHVAESELPYDLIATTNCLYITSLSYQSAHLLPIITQHAHNHNVRIAVNPGISQLKEGIDSLKESLPHIEILIMNRSEAEQFICSLGLCINKTMTVEMIAAEILKFGPSIAVITHDKHGVYVAHETEMLHHPALPVPVVDTVGAGDSFGSAFAASLFKGLPIEIALQYGIINSASVIGVIGAQPGLLTYPDLKTRQAHLPHNLIKRSPLI